MRLYRSTIGTLPGMIGVERSMFTFTQDAAAAFVLVDDPLAPQPSTLQNLARGAPTQSTPGQSQPAPGNPQPTPSHYQTTLVPVSPPGALEQLLQQLNAPWTMRHPSGAQGQSGRQQLLIDGHVFAIGTDWIVRVGNVILAGGTLKGMILEAEYLPLPDLRTPLGDGNPEFISGFLVSLLPNIPGARNLICTIPDNIWDDILWDREAEERRRVAEEMKGSGEQEAGVRANGENGQEMDQDGLGAAAKSLTAESTLQSAASSETLGTAPPDSQPPSQSQSQSQPSQSQPDGSQPEASGSKPSQSQPLAPDAMDEDKAPPVLTQPDAPTNLAPSASDASAPPQPTTLIPQPPPTNQPPPSSRPPLEEDDIFACPDDPEPSTKYDWTGMERDRRSAFSIIAALRSEGLL
ncbi:hypothetical protein HDZ31DRAFT_32423 [Schizophyllum fasciatum]